ncbi:MAG: TolC family protein [Candidatus Acidiferrales bacterium]
MSIHTNPRRIILLAALLLTAALPAAAQQGPATDQRNLTLADAIQIALKNNLSARVADARVDQAEGTRERAQAPLLPQVSGHIFANDQTVNLRALGLNFSFPGFSLPVVVGPFTNYDFRLYASQMLVNRQASHALRATDDQKQSAALDYEDARSLVVRQAAALFLDGQAAQAEVESAESRVETSQALEKLARDQHDQGLATGVDVLRAQVQLERDQQNLLVSRNQYENSLIALARYIGIRPGTPITLAEPLAFHRIEIPDADRTLDAALRARADYRSLDAQRQALVEQQKASRARYYPTLQVSGNYGAIGRELYQLPGTGLIQATLSVTLFDRDRNGERKQLDSELRQLDDQIADLSRGIEQELRTSVLDLQSATDQVRVTEEALQLAQTELALATDRFRNGLTDNIEVITAQSSLAEAQQDRIEALARHADARMALARAMGANETNYSQYLGTAAPSGEPVPTGQPDGANQPAPPAQP